MAVDFNVNVHKAGVQDIIQQAMSREVDNEANKEDPAEAARKKLAKKVAIKKESLKQTNVQKETFSREQQVNQKMKQVLGGAAGPEAADALGKWQKNGDIQQKLTDAQKQMFREAMAKNPPKATKAAQAMETLSKQPGFKEAVNNSQQMGTLQKGLLENPTPQKQQAASEIIKNRFMQSPKSDAQAKSQFMQFGMRQADKGKMSTIKQAGDMLSTLSKGNIGRSGQRAAMGMVQRNPENAKGMANVDRMVQDGNFGKMPSFARTKGTELAAKAGGKEEVTEGFTKLAGDSKFKAQTAQNKGRFFSTIGTGRPSEYRQITDSLLTSLQNPGFPKRAGQVGKFLNQVSKQVQKGGAGAINTGAAMKSAKSSPMPKLTLIKMDPDNMDEEELQQARSQNRANVMQYYQKLSRMYEGSEKGLKSAKYLEDVNKLPNLRAPEDPDLSALTPEEQQFVMERHQAVKQRHSQLQKLQRQRSRELRTKRRRGGSAGLHRARAKGRPPKYFTPGANLKGGASQAFLKSTGTAGGPAPRQGLAQSPAHQQRAARMAAGGGGDIQQQVAAALANLGGQPLTAETAGQVAQTIAAQVAQQVAAQVTESLLGAAGAAPAIDMGAAPAAAQAQPQARPARAAPNQTNWNAHRMASRDLGPPPQVVKPAGEEGPSFEEVVNERWSGKMLVKDPTSIREIGELFSQSWKDLNKPEMALLKNLGWNQQMWDTKDSAAAKWPGAMATPFVALSPLQREAVRKLGFSPHDWDKRVQAFTSGRNA